MGWLEAVQEVKVAPTNKQPSRQVFLKIAVCNDVPGVERRKGLRCDPQPRIFTSLYDCQKISMIPRFNVNDLHITNPWTIELVLNRVWFNR